MGWVKERFKTWLDIRPAREAAVMIVEAATQEMVVQRNRLWYDGDAAALHQFYSQVDDGVNNTGFWGAEGSGGVQFRKIHSGLPALLVDVLVNIVAGDLIGIKVRQAGAGARWEKIARDNDFFALLKRALRVAMVEGDGAFKISYDPAVSALPIVEFYGAERVRYERERGRLGAVVFLSRYRGGKAGRERYLLEERYTRCGVNYRLLDKEGEEVPLGCVEALAGLEDVVNPGGFLMAVPLVLEASAKWDGRGKSLFEGKGGVFDALDECISQWMDALRDGRTTRYIPETMLPRNPRTGAAMRPNPFDNRYVQTGADLSEGARNQIEVKSGEIPHEALLASYTTLLDLCLQGVVSPSTLGIDVKKLDNAEAQREKEKTTLYTRGKILRALEAALPMLVETALRVEDVLAGRVPGEYEVSVQFGEYANPSFEAQVETVGKARQYGIMSVERCVDELYGDSLTGKEKEAEVLRLKAEMGLAVPGSFGADEGRGGG